MIVDDFYVNGEIPILYTRYRDSNGELIEDTIKGYKPYFWIPANVGDYRKRRLLARYPGTQITDERAIGLDGTPLV